MTYLTPEGFAGRISEIHGPENARLFAGIQAAMRVHLTLMNLGCTAIKIEAGNVNPRITIQNDAAAQALDSVQKTRRFNEQDHQWESVRTLIISTVEVQFVVRGH